MQVLAKSFQAQFHFVRNVPIACFGTQFQIPRKVGLVGYGAIGKCFTEILLSKYPTANLVALDKFDLPYEEKRFKYLNNKVTKENLPNLLNTLGLQKGDFLVDLSTNISFIDIWTLCNKNGIRYINTALEVWDDNQDAISYPKTPEQCYKCSLGHVRDTAQKSPLWNTTKGTTTILEMGMNPGLISSCVKQGLEDAAAFYLRDPKATDLDKKALEKWLGQKNHTKLAQALGVHTIHCSEWDNQVLDRKPADLGKTFYNTWSCRGFLTEGLVPIQVARGSHEDSKFNSEYCVVRNGTTIMSHKPSTLTWANSWVPNQNVKGVLIPHGEAYTINEYLTDKETGYSPSQYYVYDYNTYAKVYVMNLPKGTTLDDANPKMEVIHPMKYPDLRGVDKVGAFLIMKNNRGWWCGSIMDDVDAKELFNWKFGPTVLQVAGGVWAGFLWACENPNAGCKYADWIDTKFILDQAKPYLGRFVSTSCDTSKTSVKDCYKLQSFLCDAPPIPSV